jgi:hypothetical protein
MQYYIEPVSGRRFRSKKDVQYYLETGTLKKRGKATENVDADTDVRKKSLFRQKDWPFHLSFNIFFSSELTCMILIVCREFQE